MEGVSQAERREVPQVRYKGQRACYFLHFYVKNLLCIQHSSENMCEYIIWWNFLKKIRGLFFIK